MKDKTIVMGNRLTGVRGYGWRIGVLWGKRIVLYFDYEVDICIFICFKIYIIVYKRKKI